MQMSYLEFLKRTLLLVAIAVLPFLIWYLFGVILITIGAIIIAMLLRLGEGRDLAARQKAGEHIFRVLSGRLEPLFAKGKFALSFDMQINDKDVSWKRNTIHDSLKAEAVHG